MIDEHASLKRPPPRDIVNLFTKQPTVWHPEPTQASIVIDSEEVGSIDTTIDGSNQLDVYAREGKRDVVLAIAEEVASGLDAKVERVDFDS